MKKKNHLPVVALMMMEQTPHPDVLLLTISGRQRNLQMRGDRLGYDQISHLFIHIKPHLEFNQRLKCQAYKDKYRVFCSRFKF